MHDQRTMIETIVLVCFLVNRSVKHLVKHVSLQDLVAVGPDPLRHCFHPCNFHHSCNNHLSRVCRRSSRCHCSGRSPHGRNGFLNSFHGIFLLNHALLNWAKANCRPQRLLLLLLLLFRRRRRRRGRRTPFRNEGSFPWVVRPNLFH